MGELSFTPAGAVPVDGAKIATGTYIGNGAYGASNPTIITFPFSPKVVFIQTLDNNSGFLCVLQGSKRGSYTPDPKNYTYQPYLTWSGNILRMYSTAGPSWQMNRQGESYRWVALI